ncbi:glucosamine--fructose-6-phosphate aminotransferase (isomerizing) [Kineococcus xinjiangensis]|uniref:Glutamine--fructose-6-phosphate aminotransferase [isomerizing] n=1 Tax=Kineococcus xinjiangensis TaxID=512762 RepID=A0A2S6IVM3_9ACTN|nr:glutamine--fructose-6-phosphate transaminase (isomerizing) [Kineococcus xinjiangensis]PPK98345.1 glucosamine--fructose-6-phosphate aminotransferase (isomerizing) [Kineococcus xinjiangensis]
MCGIVGYVGSQEAEPILLEGLRRLEYRGYDSAGLAVVHRGRLQVHRVAGRVQELREEVGAVSPAVVGIAHTRWATHGPPTVANAHPHVDTARRIAVVHNGILENAVQLRSRLQREGVALASDTDTEVIAHLVAEQLESGTATLEAAVRAVLQEVQGTYGLVVLDVQRPGELVVARLGSPVVLGVSEGEMFVASDVAALVHHTQQVVHLGDGELATVRAGSYRTSPIAPVAGGAGEVEASALSAQDYDLGDHPDFMHKEISEQPAAARRVLGGRLDDRFATAHLGGIRLEPRELRGIRRVTFLGCGSAYYAGQMGASLVEELARIPADAEPASEFRYRNPVVDPDTLYVAVSQSGETLDTLMAVQELQRKGGRVVGVVNAVGSAIARQCGQGIFLHAGPEVSVASTKALTNMTISFALLALLLGRVRDLSAADGRRLVSALLDLPDRIEEVLRSEPEVQAVAKQFAGARHMFFLGRVRGWPVAREGAQKLKEISYIHAEAYQASELKHGPLALIDSSMPSVVILPDDELYAKNLSTVEQIRARGGPVIVVTNADVPGDLADAVLRVPRSEPELDPVLLTIPLQLLAYHVALELGRDIDKPRNLAKSVTVE